MSIAELASRYLRAYQEAKKAGQALAEALTDLFRGEIIPDILRQWLVMVLQILV